MKPVGVLGGMGPEATVHFMQMVIAAVPAKDDSDHVPLLVDNNPQVPSRIAALIEGTGRDPAPTLIMMAKRLEAAGAVALAMPCNTAHHYADHVASAVDIPFLDMVDLAAVEALRLIGPERRLGLLGSPALQKVGVFERCLSRRGLSAVYPSSSDTALATIQEIKARGPSEGTAHRLGVLAAELVADGADAICICCTEFSLQRDRVTVGIPVFDSLDLLVAAAVDASSA